MEREKESWDKETILKFQRTYYQKQTNMTNKRLTITDIIKVKKEVTLVAKKKRKSSTACGRITQKSTIFWWFD